MLQEVEQKQARSPWGTREKYKAAEAAGESVPDTPPYHRYEKEKKICVRGYRNIKQDYKYCNHAQSSKIISSDNSLFSQ